MNKNLLTLLWLFLFAVSSKAQTCNLAVTYTRTTVTCHGGSNGAAIANVTGAVGSIGYLWSNGATTQTLSGVIAGTYTVTITNGNCSLVSTVVVPTKPKMAHTDRQLMTSCFGVCDGQDSLHVVGGTPPYTYLWNNGATTAVITGLCAGTYSVTTTDVNGCKNYCTRHTITDSPLLLGTATSTPTCAGSCNGTVTVHAVGGTKPYTFTWATGAGDSVATGLCAGSYQVLVTDAHGCTTIVNQNVSEVNADDNNVCTIDACDPLTLAVTNTPVNTDDNDVCTTDACDPLTGVSHTPISYDDNDVCTTDACDPLTGVSHTPISYDDNDVCTTDACDPLTGVSHTPISYDDNDVCTTDACDPLTGVSHTPISYDDNDVCTTDACNPLTGVSHTPISYDDNDVCTTDACDPLTGVSHTPISYDDNDVCTTDACDPLTGVSHTPISYDDNDVCTTDACDPLTGVSHTPISYDDNDVCTTDACDPLTGVSHTPISYDDQNACTVDACDPITGVSHTPVNTDDNNACTVDACDPATGNITHSPVNTNDNNVCTTDCCDPATGIITHNPVNINDNNPCTLDACNPVTGITHTPSAPNCTITGNNLCWGGGSTQLCVPAGQGTYLWSTGATTACINVCWAGNYTVTVTNANGCSCTSSKCVTIAQSPNACISGNNSICAGGSTQLCAQGSQGTYLWSTGATTQCITVTSAGNYTLTVTNSGGCKSTTSKCVSVSQPPNCSITVNTNCNNNNGCGGNNNGCNNGWWNNGCWNSGSYNGGYNNGSNSNNGLTQLCAASGQYSYLWSTGSNSQCINVSGGTYTVTVTNYNGCSSTCSYTVTPPPVTYWGCTLGFWKNHTSIWNNSYESIPQCLATAIAAKGYSGNGTSNSSFKTTFGLTSSQMSAAGLSSNLTLIDALNLGGGNYNKLARQGTAALLNTCGLSGHYTYTSAQVLTNVHNAIIALCAEPLATQLAAANEVSPDKCPSAGGCRMLQLGVITDENITATAYPNPFTSEATIQFSFVEETTNVTVEVYNANGSKVALLFNGNAGAGELYKLQLDGAHLAQGVYTYRINTADKSYYNKLVLIK